MKKYGSWMPQSPDLAAAAEIAVRQSLGIKEKERVLILSNPTKDAARISFALHDAVLEAGAVPVLLFQQPKTQLDFCEEEVAAALSTSPDAVISISAEKMGKDRKAIVNPYVVEGKKYDSTFHYLIHGIKKTRGFWSPGVTEDCFIRTVPIDYGELKALCGGVKKVLDEAAELRITNRNGTDITIGIRGRTSFTDDGDFSRPGTGGNLPAGETFVSPVVGSAEGTIVFDGSISSHRGVILIREPITVRVVKGYIVSVEGGVEARALLDSLAYGESKALAFETEGRLPAGKGTEYAKNARNIGELGIGLNRRARITGNMLEDEKVYGTCHFAVGSNYDEDAPALIHLDGLVSGPDIYAVMPSGENVPLTADGKLLLE
jgi:leucyl aminopeptidase (aminopeptidase T)